MLSCKLRVKTGLVIQEELSRSKHIFPMRETIFLRIGSTTLLGFEPLMVKNRLYVGKDETA